VELALEELINSATEEERQTLKEILDSWSTSPAAISKAFQKRSLNIFQRVAGSTRTYNEILFGVASEHGVYRRFFETAEDLERRLIRIASASTINGVSASPGATGMHTMLRLWTITRSTHG
jgi:hypothetical protein